MFGGFFAIYTIQFLHFKCLNTYWWHYSFHVHAHVHNLTYSCHSHYILSLQFTSVAFHSFIFQMKWEYVNLVPALFKEWIKAKSGKRGGGGLFHSRRFSRLGVQEKVLFQMPHPKRDQYPAPHFQSLYTSTVLINRTWQKEDGRRNEKQGLTAYIWPTALMSPVWLGRICLVLLLCRIMVSDTKLAGVLAWNKLNMQLNCVTFTHI